MVVDRDRVIEEDQQAICGETLQGTAMVRDQPAERR
jgi:hypothetical protein